jgi:hypothetical protein
LQQAQFFLLAGGLPFTMLLLQDSVEVHWFY